MAVLVVGLSGRPLAAAVRRSGERCLVIDLFGDRDTVSLAEQAIVVPAGRDGGLDDAAVLAAVDRLAPTIEAIAWGMGLEDRPTLLQALARRAPVIGNGSDVVRRIKEPASFAGLLAAAGLPHPPTSLTPRSGGDWLVKDIGGAGGGHIRLATDTASSQGAYWQRRAPGHPISALFLADGRRARVIGFSRQWVSPAPGAPFRFGGCATPASLSPVLAAAMTDACARIVQASGLVGLNSLDMLVSRETWTILEVNPRPGATLDIFDANGALSLWSLHRAAVAGHLPDRLPAPAAPRASMVVYAPRALVASQGRDWPDWTADRPQPNTRFAAGDPVCTVLAESTTTVASRALARRRRRLVLERLVSPADTA